MHASLLGNREGPGLLPSKLQAGPEGGGFTEAGGREMEGSERGRKGREGGGHGEEEGERQGGEKEGMREEQRRGSRRKIGEEGGMRRGVGRGEGESLLTLQTTISGLQVSAEGSCQPWLFTDRTTGLQCGKLGKALGPFPLSRSVR